MKHAFNFRLPQGIKIIRKMKAPRTKPQGTRRVVFRRKRRQPRHGLARARNDDLFTLRSTINVARKLGFCLVDIDCLHKRPRND